jgi:hypothetical protein
MLHVDIHAEFHVSKRSVLEWHIAHGRDAFETDAAQQYVTRDPDSNIFVHASSINNILLQKSYALAKITVRLPKSSFFFKLPWVGETESTWYVGHCLLIVPAPDDR